MDAAVREIITSSVFSDETPLYIKNNEKSSCLGGWSSVPPPSGSLTGHRRQADCLLLQAGLHRQFISAGATPALGQLHLVDVQLKTAWAGSTVWWGEHERRTSPPPPS